MGKAEYRRSKLEGLRLITIKKGYPHMRIAFKFDVNVWVTTMIS